MIKEFNRFYINGFDFDYDSLQLNMYYSFDDDVNFVEKIDLKSQGFDIRKNIDKDIINNIIPSISIAFAISYYKLYPTKEIIVNNNLDKEQLKFWNKYYVNGLGEFLYKNKLSPKGLMNFKVNPEGPKFKSKIRHLSNRCLVPFGGGKDSLLTIDFIENSGLEYDLFVFGKDYKLHSDVANYLGKLRLLISRQIDPLLFEMSKQGYYNGHVPITGQISFLMTLVSYLYDYKYLVFSNEKSSNFGNLIYDGIEINHQYSKSLEFEKDFGNYVSKYISIDLKSFSLLRNMYEIKIIEMFSKNKDYLNIFSSCNKNFYQDPERRINNKWCGECPKCAFVFACLSAFIDRDELIQIFNKDLYEDKALEDLFKELLGIKGNKPFECVGTNEEMVLAMYLALKNYKGKELPYILKMFKEEVLSTISEEGFVRLEDKLMKVYDENVIPKEFLDNGEK